MRDTFDQRNAVDGGPSGQVGAMPGDEDNDLHSLYADGMNDQETDKTIEFGWEDEKPLSGRRAAKERAKKRKMKPGSFGTLSYEPHHKSALKYYARVHSMVLQVSVVAFLALAVTCRDDEP